MVKLEAAVIARLTHSGERFEILVDPKLALDLKHGSKVSFDELLATETVFKDAHKGEAKSEDSIKKAFGTTDLKEVARKIITDGEVQLTTEQRRDLLEKRHKEIVGFIARNAYNPQTNAPHPEIRIENAIEEAKIRFDIQKPFNEQVEMALKEIRKLIPISMEAMKVAVKVPAQYSGKASGVLHRYGVKQESWLGDGSLVAVLELPSGLKNDLFAELNNITKGNVETKIIGK